LPSRFGRLAVSTALRWSSIAPLRRDQRRSRRVGVLLVITAWVRSDLYGCFRLIPPAQADQVRQPR
jgi:hypothetical protein